MEPLTKRERVALDIFCALVTKGYDLETSRHWAIVEADKLLRELGEHDEPRDPYKYVYP